MSKKRQRIDRQLEAYAFLAERCAICFWPKYVKGWRRDCCLHHLVGRRGLDCHDHRNLLMVCTTCHEIYHGQASVKGKDLTLGHMLEAKRQEDGEVDIPFLAKLMRRVGLREDPMPLPGWVLREREENYAKGQWAAKGRTQAKEQVCSNEEKEVPG